MQNIVFASRGKEPDSVCSFRNDRANVLDTLKGAQRPGKARIDGKKIDLNAWFAANGFEQTRRLYRLATDDIERGRNQQHSNFSHLVVTIEMSSRLSKQGA